MRTDHQLKPHVPTSLRKGLRWAVIPAAGLILGLQVTGTREVAADPGCPEVKSKKPCIQVIVYGKQQGKGTCCEFPNPCSVPKGWKTYYSLEECQAAP